MHNSINYEKQQAAIHPHNSTFSGRGVCEMHKGLIRCPDCAGEPVLIGPIPSSDIFAGRELAQPISGGYLYRCSHCFLGFRWPRFEKEKLDALYIQGSYNTRSAPSGIRNDLQIAHAWISKNLPQGSSILDIGCFDGTFLKPLVHIYRCYGIEIHPIARCRAQEKGVAIMGADFSVIPGSFDLITALDVIEHTESPRRFLLDCLSALRPEGFLIISTGNLDAFTFRLMGSRYYYCTPPEHISFISPVWFRRIVGEMGCQVVMETTFIHGNTALHYRVRQALLNFLYRFYAPAFRSLRKLGLGGKNVKLRPELVDHPPSWLSARDHFLVVAQRR